jgi:large conductance mechanosensitive channel
MALWADFKKFAFKGNVVDLAIGVMIGGAFGKIVTALVNDLVMPFVALFLPRGNWRETGLVLRHGAVPAEDVVLKYGDFLGAVLDFMIVSMVLFAIVSRVLQAVERTLRLDPSAAMRECPFCKENIRADAKRCKACTSELASA